MFFYNSMNGIYWVAIIFTTLSQSSGHSVHRNGPPPTLIDHSDIGLDSDKPLNIAHRGTSGVYPEHTAAAYRQAVEDGADMIECDITITRDLRLVCRHESWIGHTTNVKDIAKFADREKTYLVDGANITDWFTVDFTLEELLEIRAVQPLSFRDQSFNTNFTIATFDEYVEIAKSRDPPVGIYPEIKNPAFINSVPGFLPNGTRFEDIVIQELTRHGYTGRGNACLLQAFDEECLTYLIQSVQTDIPLVMCMWIDVDDSVLDRWAELGFYGLCIWKDQIYRNYKDGGYKNYIFESTDLVEKIHDRGFKLHVYTFRNEDTFIGWDYAQDIFNEYDKFFAHNIEGYFTDYPATLRNYMEMVYHEDTEDNRVTCGVSRVVIGNVIALFHIFIALYIIL